MNINCYGSVSQFYPQPSPYDFSPLYHQLHSDSVLIHLSHSWLILCHQTVKNDFRYIRIFYNKMRFNASTVAPSPYPDLPEKNPFGMFISVSQKACHDWHWVGLCRVVRIPPFRPVHFMGYRNWMVLETSTTDKTNLDGHLFTSNTDSSDGRFLTQICLDKSWNWTEYY